MKYLRNINEGESHNHAKIEQILALQSSFPHEGLLHQMDIAKVKEGKETMLKW